MDAVTTQSTRSNKVDTRTTELHLDSWVGLCLALGVIFEIFCWIFTILCIRTTWAFRRRIIQLHGIDNEALTLEREARQDGYSAFYALLLIAGFYFLSYKLL